jgi:hypothetical protein
MVRCPRNRVNSKSPKADLTDREKAHEALGSWVKTLLAVHGAVGA